MAAAGQRSLQFHDHLHASLSCLEVCAAAEEQGHQALTSTTPICWLVQTLAEKVAWDLSKKHGFELVTINPVFVFGRVLSSRADATSVLMMKVVLSSPDLHASYNSKASDLYKSTCHQPPSHITAYVLRVQDCSCFSHQQSLKLL